MTYFKGIYELVCKDIAEKIADNKEIVEFIQDVYVGIVANADKGYRIYGRDSAVDEVHMISKAVGMEEGLVWGFLIRHFDQAGIEIQQTQFSVLFKIKDCI